MSIRETAVAGQFYPARVDEIRGMIEHYNKILDEHVNMDELLDLKTRAVIVPHAGYVYSGFTANVALRILGAQKQIERVVVIGPSHRVYLEGVSVADYDRYETPFGDLKVDKTLVRKLEQEYGLAFYPEAHAEHSTEVQMPFVKYYLSDVSVVELVYGKEDPAHLSGIIDMLLDDPHTAVVISTDLSHYYDIEKANKLDSICLDAVSRLDPLELHQGCEACGKIGVEAMILSARERGLKPKVLDYRTSADASGDKSQVVGYASAVFVEEAENG
ncbi:MAG: AmmeMemoRadiSam system protein B [Sulfurovum sp.]|nr:AmmeMemoRadiSam system protein B [Sulfurovum sp.]